jgi:hypothetical protein
MYDGSLPPATNRAGYTQDFQLFDDAEDQGIDLAGAVITLDIRKPGCAAAELSATTANGRIVITDADEGHFALVLAASDMRSLAPMAYACGMTIAQNGDTTQIFIGTLPVLDGVTG